MMSTKITEKQASDVAKNVTFDEVISVAKKITNDGEIRVLDYSLNDYSEEKLGYTASHHILKISVQKSNAESHETISAFVKIVSIPVSDDFDKNIDFSSIICDTETFFLETLVSKFKDSYKDERWWPTYYYSNKNVLIMEDLKSSGYKLLEDFYDNYAVLKSVLTSLARFHSCSILAEARISQDSQCPVALNEHYKDRCSESVFLENGEGASWFASVTKLTCALAEYFGYDAINVRNLFDRLFDLMKPSEIYRNVVCHGDVHSKNLMFADGSPLPKCILIDFQTYGYAPLVTDILQFLHINATRKFRKHHEVKLIEFYHYILTETIKNNDFTGMVKVPTLEDIMKGMEDLRLFGLIMACIYYPFLFVDPVLLKKRARDSEFQKEFFVGDRVDFTFSHMKDNEFYKNKIEEAIRELVERS